MILHTYPILDLLDKDWLSCSTQIMYTVVFNGRTARQYIAPRERHIPTSHATKGMCIVIEMSSPITVITTCITIPIAATGRMQTWKC